MSDPGCEKCGECTLDCTCDDFDCFMKYDLPNGLLIEIVKEGKKYIILFNDKKCPFHTSNKRNAMKLALGMQIGANMWNKHSYGG